MPAAVLADDAVELADDAVDAVPSSEVTRAEMFAALIPDSSDESCDRAELAFVLAVLAVELADEAVEAAADAVDAVPVSAVINADSGLPEPPTMPSMRFCMSVCRVDARLDADEAVEAADDAVLLADDAVEAVPRSDDTKAEMFAALMPDSRFEMSVETVVASEDALDAVVAADDAVDAVPVRLLTNADNGLPEPPTTSSINVCTSVVTPDMRPPGMASSADPSSASV